MQVVKRNTKQPKEKLSLKVLQSHGHHDLSVALSQKSQFSSWLLFSPSLFPLIFSGQTLGPLLQDLKYHEGLGTCRIVRCYFMNNICIKIHLSYFMEGKKIVEVQKFVKISLFSRETAQPIQLLHIGGFNASPEQISLYYICSNFTS